MQHKHHIVFLTGAGISQESGISTFRDANGLWNNHKIEEVASPEGFESYKKAINLAKVHDTKVAISLSDPFIVNTFKNKYFHLLKIGYLLYQNDKRQQLKKLSTK